MADRPAALSSFQTYGWKPDPSLSIDVNMIDLTLLITRSSTLRQGSMACILVRPPEQSSAALLPAPEPTTGQIDTDQLLDSIVSIANNQSFYIEGDSDIHAEIVALGQMCRAGCKTNGCTAYITMPPCKRCLVALYSAGIKRIVSRYAVPDVFQRVAVQHEIEFVDVSDESVVKEEQKIRLDALVQAYYEAQAEAEESSDDPKENAS